MSITGNLTAPISQPTYLFKGAVGGYLGAYMMAKYQGVQNIDPMGRFQLESALAGAAGNYIWLLVGSNVDTYSMWKGVAVGILSEWIWNAWLAPYVKTPV